MLIDNIIRFYKNKNPVTEHKAHEEFILKQLQIRWRYFMRCRKSKHIIPIINVDFQQKHQYLMSIFKSALLRGDL